LARARMHPDRIDALLAGAAFGAAVLTRVGIGLVVLLAFALEPFFRPAGRAEARSRGFALGSSASTVVFAVALVAVAAVTVVAAAAIPGTWTLPLTDHLRNAWIRLLIAHGYPSPIAIAAVIGGSLGATALDARWTGWSALLRAAVVVAVIGGQATSANFLYDRTPMWLSFVICWS